MTVMITIFTQFQDYIITEISFFALVLVTASQYFDGFLESYSRNCDVILAVIVAFIDMEERIVYVTWNSHRKHAYM